jgi:hypothetical protein
VLLYSILYFTDLLLQKFLMIEYESLGPKDFWGKWSINGNKCTGSSILDGLAKDRKEKERRDARAAKEAHTADFQDVFSYTKSRRTFKMTSEKGIARRFRKSQAHDCSQASHT